MELKHINTEISQLATMEAVNMLSEHGKEKLKEFRYLKSLHESKVKNLGIHSVSFSEAEVCRCKNTNCMHHKGTFCMAAAWSCEDRQT